MIPANEIIKLSPRAFWDVDMSKMDYEKNADYIICKVFDRGSLEDVAEVLAYYGGEKVKSALLTASSLRKQTMHFAASYFNLPLSSFQCYTTMQSHRIY